MTTNLPPEAVEAAARAMHAARYPRFEWDGEDKAVKGLYRDRARAALSAALPLLPDVGDLLAELDRLRAVTVKPDRDTIARAIAPQSWRVYDADGGREESAGAPGAHWSRERADAVLAVLPGRTEAQVKAEALREAAKVLKDGMDASAHFDYPVPHVADAVDWLEDRADRIERGES